MARPLGTTLPAPLIERLRGDDLAARVGIGIILLTIDTMGWPHPAMLSYGEIVALDSRRVRLALHQASGTAANLRRWRRITLCFVEAGMAYYVKAGVEPLEQRMAGHPGLARFEVTVDTVLADEARADSEPGAAILDGVRFGFGRAPAEVLRDWQSVVDSLRADP